MVCVRLFVRFSLLSQYSDHVGLLETECECGYVPYLDIVSMVYIYGLYLVKVEAVNEKEDS